MTKVQIFNGLTRSFNRLSLHLKKHSPEILIVAGVVGTVASAVMACKATTKVNDILTDAKTQIDQVHEVAKTKSDIYSEEDSKKVLAIIYAQTGVKLVKLYAPSVILGTLSLTSIVSSHHILRKRNMALAAAYTAVDTSFKEYRGRVIDRFGEELDRELKYNIKAREIEEVSVNEKGEEEVTKRTVEVANPNEYSDYARFFDDGNIGWTKDPETNLMFLRRQQDWANELLKAKGHLFLNEVYDMLGIPRTKAGQIVGWIYDEKNPVGDNFVDFGIYDIHKPRNRDFVNGIERTILLDFNVDGNILDLI